MRFLSDNTAPACPEICDALVRANTGRVKSYGEDEWTRSLDRVFGDYFGHEVRVFPLVSGTAANALSLATLCPPYGVAFAHQGAHVVRDECGATEFFSHGARLALVPGASGRMTPEALIAALADMPISGHGMQPAALTLTQATELGTAYRPEQIAALTEIAHRHNLKVHMDGARFANAVTFLGCSPADVTWRSGVDVLSFGATKNGAMGAEAVVFFDPTLVRDFDFRRQRGGHLLSKSRYISAQLVAYVETGVWQRNAARANALARKVGAAAGDTLLYPVEANEIFLKLSSARTQALRAAGFEFHEAGNNGEIRLVVSWDQPEEEVDALCRALSPK